MKRVTLAALAFLMFGSADEPDAATGRVYVDANNNSRFDPGELPLSGVRVSNGITFATTDRSGKWKLPIDDDTILFVVKPRGYMTPLNNDRLPRFYYVHKPNGSPPVKYGGVQPTGALPASIDFAMYPQREPSRFKALFFGDTQPRDLREVEYIAHDIVEPIAGKTDAAFGVTLGDIVFDDLSVFEPLNATIALIGIPWYNVLGNHDINYDVPTDEHSDETFERVYGPPYYSFDYGPTHFVVLDDVNWIGADPLQNRRGSYRAGLGRTQLDWLRQDLAAVPKNQLVVLMMHIPMFDIEEKAELYALLAERPYCISVSAHTHYQEHHFLGRPHGFPSDSPHHHIVNVTTCGSWWQGSPDEFGIPHTTMRDGAPNGYSIFSFDGNQYSIEFRAARSLPSYQMNIIIPPSIERSVVPSTSVFVNVFGGTSKSTVEMRIGPAGAWTRMERSVEPDPMYAAMFEADRTLALPFRALPAPVRSPHLWKAPLPPSLPRGVHAVHVRTTDMFSQTYLATRAIRID